MKNTGMLALLALAAFTISAAVAAERFPQIPAEKMTPAQKAVADAIVAGPRGSLQGPFVPWLRSPELADRLQKVGEQLRYKSSLPPRLNEFVILITAREWDSEYEWFIHHPPAVKAGLSAQVIADLAAGRRPHGMQKDEQIVYDYSIQLHRNKGNVSDELHSAAITAFGEQGVIDLIGVNGYYTVVAMTIAAAKVALPAGQTTLISPSK